jgi:manganese efflux pump family protein
MEKLKAKWGIQSNLQLIIVFVVFAVTGSSSVFVSTPLFDYLGISKESLNILIYYVLKIIIVFPVYLVLLLFFGFISGQIKFFWKFEKNMLINMGFGFLFK